MFNNKSKTAELFYRLYTISTDQFQACLAYFNQNLTFFTILPTFRIFRRMIKGMKSARQSIPPKFCDHSVRVGHMVNLPALLQSFGIDPKNVLEENGFKLAQFEDPDCKISYIRASTLLARCVTATECQHFGLLLGMRSVPSYLGITGFLVRAAPDIGKALANLIDYLDLQDQGGTAFLTIIDEIASLGYKIHQTGVESLDQAYDLSIAAGCNIMRNLCGPRWNPDRVFLSRSQPDDLEPYEDFFKAPLHFDADQNAMEFPTCLLSREVPSADPLLYQHLVKEANALRIRHPVDLTGELRAVLYRCLLEGELSAIQVAKQFGMDKRAVSRWLHAEGTTYRDELNTVRSAVSRQLLSSTSIAVTEIATLLGYSETSVFSRAFKRWSGKSPTQWRKDNTYS